MVIGICLPTRGIIDTLTIESILRNAHEVEHYGPNIKWYFTNDLPLPDSRIDITDRALADGCEYLWWVDDDMVIPDGFLLKMLEVADENTVATGAYYMQNGMKSVYYKDKEARQCGFGCALIHRNIYENTPKPWYLVNKSQVTFGKGKDAIVKWIDNPMGTWGGEDIWFYHQAIDIAGFKMKEVGDVGHLRIRTWGQKYLNGGVHDIYFLTEKGQDGFEVRDDKEDVVQNAIKNMERQSED